MRSVILLSVLLFLLFLHASNIHCDFFFYWRCPCIRIKKDSKNCLCVKGYSIKVDIKIYLGEKFLSLYLYIVIINFNINVCTTVKLIILQTHVNNISPIWKKEKETLIESRNLNLLLESSALIWGQSSWAVVKWFHCPPDFTVCHWEFVNVNDKVESHTKRVLPPCAFKLHV